MIRFRAILGTALLWSGIGLLLVTAAFLFFEVAWLFGRLEFLSKYEISLDDGLHWWRGIPTVATAGLAALGLLLLGMDLEEGSRDDRIGITMSLVLLGGSVVSGVIAVSTGAIVVYFGEQSMSERTQSQSGSPRGIIATGEYVKDAVATITLIGEEGTMPLHVAAIGDDYSSAQRLIAEGVDIAARAKYGLTPLHAAALHGSVNVAALLLDSGAKVDPRNNSNFTPLHLAAIEGRVSMVALLLDRGADIDAETRKGRTPAGLAALYGKADVLNLIRERGGKE